ncbi:beta strand repeat-containing protein, partial [Winogradskyella endarachnes]
MKIFLRFSFTNTRILLLILFSFVWINQSFAQPGKDGDLVVSAANTVLNTYGAVSADIAVGDEIIQVYDLASDIGTLSAGDLIMIYQAQGASINTSNTINYGEITSYNSAGLYEFVYVTGVSGNNITISCGVSQAYSVAGRVQVIKVPQYNNLTIDSGASVTALEWQDYAGGRRGGLVVIDATTVTVNGLVDVSGLGFRGGIRENSTLSSGSSIQDGYVSTSSADSAEKGESIAGFNVEYDLLGGRYGRGAPANGGGGGNSHNAGGGGGANGNNGVVWLDGAGNMCATCTGSSAWSLDPNYIANGNSLTVSSGGGRGGYSFSGSNQDALSVGPSNTSWSGNRRENVGGLGGRPLVANEVNRIFFGGGGGAGDGNNNANQSATNGAGIILIRANQINGTGNFSANGLDGSNTIGGHNDAPSGAGAGGSIVLKSASIANTLVLDANGGAGGNQLITNTEAEGPGGGGSGGFIAISSGSPTININGGDSGVTSSSALTEFPVNGGTDGGTGLVISTATTPSIACIDAVNDDFSLSSIDNTVGGITSSVYNNDSLYGVSFLDSDVVPSILDDDGIAGLVINSDGTLTIPAGTAAGTYVVEYQICEVSDPSNCDTAFVTLVVNDGSIDAVFNDYTSSPISDSAGGSTPSVFDNDTLNGVSFADGDVVPNINDDDGLTGAVINSDGTITVPPNTPSGTYNIEYEICEVGNLSNCDVAIATIVVFDSLISNDDDFSATTISDFSGGTTSTVYINDTLNGVTVTASDVTPSIVNDGGLTGVSINADGTIDVPAGLASGTYTVTYEICETANTTNCTTSDVTIVIEDAINADDDDFSSALVIGGDTTADSVFDNDTLNSSTVATGDVDVSIINEGGLTGVTINTDGTLNIPASASAGVYTITYEICETSTSNCDTAEVIVLVGADSDGDGVVDSTDLDDDNDGISDVDEDASCIGSIQYEFYDSTPSGNTVDNIPTDVSLALSIGTVSSFDVDALQNSVDPGDTNTFSVRFRGNINITTAGLYTFYTSSDDGSKLFIDGIEIVDNDGGHGVITENGSITLTIGLHEIVILYFENTGGESLTAEYEGPSVTRQFIPFTSLSCILDTDGDGIPNQLDLDSDNDGCSDANEAYNDANADGGDGSQFGTGNPASVDASNGLVTETGVDYSLGTNTQVTDGDFTLSVCYVDPCDPVASGNLDTDGDNITDVCDLDDDNDGILDVFECPSSDSGIDGSISDLAYDVTTNDANSSTESHYLNSITVSGFEYTDFILPSGYSNNISNVTANDMVYITENNIGEESNLFTDSDDLFDVTALSAFQDRNLNHFQYLNNKDFTADSYDLIYSYDIVTTAGMFIAITERGGNNRVGVEALDNLGNSLGSIFVN